MTVLTVEECKKLTPAETKLPTPTTGVSCAQDMPAWSPPTWKCRGPGHVGENEAIAIIKAHPGWLPEYQEDDEEKEEEYACSKNCCRCSKAGR